MNNFKNLQSMSIDQLVEWLDVNGSHNSIWWTWFEENYCDKCETETVEISDFEGENEWKTKCECAYCETHDKCRFFSDMNDVPDAKETIKLWLEAEVYDEEI